MAKEKSTDQQLAEFEGTQDGDREENVKVMVRCRPLSSSEMKRSEKSVVGFQTDGNNYDDERSINVENRQFRFDYVFKPERNNEYVYMKSMRKLTESAFKGYNCTVFLYGQTGTGKTYTHSSLTLDSFKHIFTLIQDSDKQVRFLIRASYYELYNEEIRDLLVSYHQTAFN